jgi:hypothetical protein
MTTSSKVKYVGRRRQTASSEHEGQRATVRIRPRLHPGISQATPPQQTGAWLQQSRSGSRRCHNQELAERQTDLFCAPQLSGVQAALTKPNGGYVRVPLRSKGGNLAGRSATLFRESLACGNAPGGPRCGNRLTGNCRAPTGWRPCSRQRRSRRPRVGRCPAWWTGCIGRC